jgi:hypothetical protein
MQGMFVGKLLEKTPVQRPRMCSEENIKIVRYVMRTESGWSYLAVVFNDDVIQISQARLTLIRWYYHDAWSRLISAGEVV